jgi:hypothetical protein
MPELLTPSRRNRIFIATLIAVGLLRFVNLGFLDLQAWDEALYATRAEGILMFGGFLDQTSFAIGGLYSSMHPPLYVWLSSLSFLLFGVTEFAARFWSAFFGGLTLMVIYRLGKELQSDKLGFIAALLFGLNPFVTFYARQGQFDTLLVFFVSLAFLLYLRMESQDRTKFAILSGLAVGAALMTKLFVGFGIPLTFFLWKAATQDEEHQISWKPFMLSIGVLVLVAGPWHLYMTILRGFGDPLFLLNASAVLERSYSGIEGNVKPLEVLYFFNQLLVLFPLGVIWFGFGLYRTFRERSRPWLLLSIWFLVFFIVSSLMRTKLAVYLLPMLVPASLIGAREILDVSSGQYSKRLVALVVGVTGICFLWASNQTWRNLAKSILAELWHAHIPPMQTVGTFLPFISLLCCILLLTYLLYRNDTLTQLRAFIPALLLVPSFLLTFYNVVGHDQYQYMDGAQKLAQFVEERQPSVIVVAGFGRNPQLTFYLEGADIGWRDDIEVRRVTPPKIRSQFRAWLSEQAGNLQGDALVVAEKDKFIRYEWVTAEEINPPDFSLVFDSRRYAVFQRLPTTQLALFSSQRLP